MSESHFQSQEEQIFCPDVQDSPVSEKFLRHLVLFSASAASDLILHQQTVWTQAAQSVCEVLLTELSLSLSYVTQGCKLSEAVFFYCS